MNAVFKWSLRQRRWSIIWWSLGLFGLVFINLIFYPSFRDQGEQLRQSFNNLPDTAVQFLGGSTDFFSAVGFLNSQLMFFLVPIVCGMLAIILGGNLIRREEQSLTIELLLSRPISRSGLLVAKALTGIAILTSVMLFSLIVTLITVKAVDMAVPLANISLCFLACYLLSLSVGAIAFTLTTIGWARAASFGIATSVALGGYIISSLAGTVAWLKVPSKIFPFNYYHSEAILRGTYNWANAIFYLGIILACVIISWLAFRRRDIKG